MDNSDATGYWIEALKAGNHDAAQHLWNRYFERMVRLARGKLHGLGRAPADEEDVALSAFHSFCRGAAEGRFPVLQDRDNLWSLLVVITARKAIKLREREGRQKRGGGAVQDEGAFGGEEGLNQIVGAEPSPAFAAQVAEEFQRLLDRLKDEELRSVALWKLEGYSNEEIAGKLGCVPRTVVRRLQVIRGLLEQEGGASA